MPGLSAYAEETVCAESSLHSIGCICRGGSGPGPGVRLWVPLRSVLCVTVSSAASCRQAEDSYHVLHMSSASLVLAVGRGLCSVSQSCRFLLSRALPVCAGLGVGPGQVFSFGFPKDHGQDPRSGPWFLAAPRPLTVFFLTCARCWCWVLLPVTL